MCIRDSLWVLYPGERAYPLAPRVSALPIAEVGTEWSYPDFVEPN